MKKIDTEFKKLFNTLKYILILILFFILFCIVFLYPIYWLSVYHLKEYSILTILVTSLFILFLMGKDLFYRYKKYNNLKYLLADISLKIFAPLLVFILLINLEIVLLKLFLEIVYSKALSIILFGGVNIPIIFLLFYLNILRNRAALSLKKRELKNIA